MRSRHVIPALIMTGAVLTGASPALAGSCAMHFAGALPGAVIRCTYVGDPPTATLTTTVSAGTVEFIWQCGTEPPITATGNATVSRPRAASESCVLTAVVVVGPATFTATAT